MAVHEFSTFYFLNWYTYCIFLIKCIRLWWKIWFIIMFYVLIMDCDIVLIQSWIRIGCSFVDMDMAEESILWWWIFLKHFEWICDFFLNKIVNTRKILYSGYFFMGFMIEKCLKINVSNQKYKAKFTAIECTHNQKMLR